MVTEEPFHVADGMFRAGHISALGIVAAIHTPDDDTTFGIRKTANCPGEILLISLLESRILAVARDTFVVNEQLFGDLFIDQLLNCRLSVRNELRVQIRRTRSE